jgi:hypothetical protein
MGCHLFGRHARHRSSLAKGSAARGAGLAVVISRCTTGENNLAGDDSLAGAALVLDHLDADDGGPVTVASLGALLP